MGFSADRILDHLVQGVGSGDRYRTRPAFFCPCTRQRALDTLALLGFDDIRSMLDGGESQEVRCHFCGEAYELTPAELRARFSNA
jgi:molecular chaperone Hsp33